jgi:hypothetical protein
MLYRPGRRVQCIFRDSTAGGSLIILIPFAIHTVSGAVRARRRDTPGPHTRVGGVTTA